MKRIRIMLILAGLIFALASCEKSEGPAGPAGQAGPAGANGTNGNANVIQFDFTGFTITDANTYHDQMFALSMEQCNQSILMAYVLADGPTPVWYPIPGYTSSGACEYRAFYRTYPSAPDSSEFCMRRITGSGDDVIDSLRILAIPASVIVDKSAAELPDWNDYHAVTSYFGIK